MFTSYKCEPFMFEFSYLNENTMQFKKIHLQGNEFNGEDIHFLL